METKRRRKKIGTKTDSKNESKEKGKKSDDKSRMNKNIKERNEQGWKQR